MEEIVTDEELCNLKIISQRSVYKGRIGVPIGDRTDQRGIYLRSWRCHLPSLKLCSVLCVVFFVQRPVCSHEVK